MAIGQLVFPSVIVGFVLFLGGFLASTPATPAPQDLGQRSLRVEPGDAVVLEATGYYGNGFVFFSTQEERQASFKIGPITPSFQLSPLTFRVDTDPNITREGLHHALLGHRVGDAFTTPQLPPRLAFGDWAGNISLNRTLEGFPLTVRYTPTTNADQGQAFNLTDYLRFWGQRGYELKMGTEWPCQGEQLWTCKVTQFDPDAGIIAFRIEVTPGQTFPVIDLMSNVQTGGDLTWNTTIVSDPEPDHFGIRLDPPVGVRFQVRDPSGAPFEPGTYEVTGVDDAHIQLRYSAATTSQPSLVGEPVWYDLVVVRIQRA